MKNILPFPTRYAARLSEFGGVEWKHEDAPGSDCFSRPFCNFTELLRWAGERYGKRMENKLEKLTLSREWQGKLS